jgi:menaquinone-specific isochorismate synthase
LNGFNFPVGWGIVNARPGARLAVRTTVADPGGSLLDRLPQDAPGKVAWIRDGDGFVGWGEAARVLVPTGEDRFAWAQKWLTELFDGADVRDEAGVPGSGPVAFGSFTFDPRDDGSALIVPKVVIGRRDGVAWVTVAGDGEAPAPRPVAAHAATAPAPEVRWSDGTVTGPAHMRAVAEAVAAIRAGRLSKVVLARDLFAHAAQPIDVTAVLARLADRFPSCYTFACSGLVGATPELLIRRIGGEISSLVLAGTIANDGTASDADRLLASVKDREEHAYAADMVRAALAPLCGDLHVPAEPRLLRLANLIHLATPISGHLDQRRSVLDVLAALHPTPAVGGTPTRAAIEVIRELEAMERGRYAGPVGWIDANGDGEWGIALRCAEIDGRHARLFAGGGIVADSDPEVELAETQTKLRAMRYALDG